MDDWLFFLINRVWTNIYAARLFATLTSAAVWLPFLTVGLGVGLWFGTFRIRSFLLVAAVDLLAVGGPFNSVAKRWFHRPRPAEAESGVREVALQKVHPAFLGIFLAVRVGYSGNTREPTRGRSFPSGHVVNNALVATLALVYFRMLGLLVTPVALLVAYSRIYCGSHWPALLRPASQPVSQPVTVAAWTLTSTRDRVAFWIQLVVVFARRVCLNA